MVLDLGKRYTFAGHEYEFCRSGCHWDSCEDGIPCFSVDEFRFFGNAGLVTEVREPIVASGVMEFNGTGFCQSSMVPACGLTYNQVSGKTFKVTMEEVME